MSNFKSLKMLMYEGLWRAIILFARFISLFSLRAEHHLEQRLAALAYLSEWARIRSRYPKAIVFVCSSAGEYEQAKPLMTRLTVQGDYALFILFFSPSGLRFATSQKESLPFALVASDRPTYWREVGAQLRPDAFVFVRYELWPGMVNIASQYAPLYLIDGAETVHLRKKRIARALRSALLKPMKKVFVVGSSDSEFYKDVLKVPSEKVLIAGDTKYDRVLERMAERSQALDRFRVSLAEFLKGRRVLVLGSAWPRDLQEFITIYAELKAFDPAIAVIIAPHDLSAANLETMLKMLDGLSICRVSQDGYERAGANHDVLFVDVLGDLPELYGCAHLAWVGGAMHYRVHNVLEPACRGLYLCFGPHYETSQEAKGLVNQELARVIHNGLEFLQWYKNLAWTSYPPHQTLWQAVVKQKGASDRILLEILSGRRL